MKRKRKIPTINRRKRNPHARARAAILIAESAGMEADRSILKVKKKKI